MNIFDEFRNYELPNNFKYHDNISFYSQNQSTLVEKYSKHNNPALWYNSLDCQIETNIYFNMTELGMNIGTNGTISRWISYQMHEGYNIFDAKFLLTSEYIQIAIMICSIILIFFIACLLRRKKKRARYSPLSHTSNPVIMV